MIPSISEVLIFILGCLICLAVAVPICVWNDRQRATQERLSQEWMEGLRIDHPELCLGTPEFEQRYQEPEFRKLADFLGKPVPQSYRELFEDLDIVRTRHTKFDRPTDGNGESTLSGEIDHFVPADVLGQEMHWSGIEGMRMEGFKNKGEWLFFGVGDNGTYCLALDEGDEFDCPVYLWDVEYDRRHRLADSLVGFLFWRSDDSTHPNN